MRKTFKRRIRFRRERLLNDRNIPRKTQNVERVEQQDLHQEQEVVQGTQYEVSGRIDASIATDNNEVVKGKSQDSNSLTESFRQFM